MNPFKSSIRTLMHEKELRNLMEAPGIAYKFPIYKAFDNWLRKINGAMERPEDVKEKNNKIFAAFMFLLDHDYLFYLTMTRQVLVIKELFEKNGIRLLPKEEDLLTHIEEAYEQAVLNQLLFKVHTRSTTDSSHAKEEPYPMVMPNCSEFEIYCHLHREYALLNYHYQKEEVQLFRDLYDDHLSSFLDVFDSDSEIPDHIKEELRPVLREHINSFYSEMVEIEEELPNLFSFHQDMPAESHDAASTSEDLSSVYERAPSLHQRLPSVDQRAPIVHQRVPSSDQQAPTVHQRVPSALGEGGFKPSSIKVGRLIERFETLTRTLVNPHTQQVKHESLRPHYENFQRGRVKLDAYLEFLNQKYKPALEHIGEKLSHAQQSALDKINVDLNAFMKILVQTNLNDKGDKEQIDEAIEHLSQLARKLNDQNDAESIKAVLQEYLSELDNINDLFAKNGALNEFQMQYKALKENIKQQANLNPAPVSLCTVEAEQSIEPKVSKFAARRAAWSNRFFRAPEHTQGELIVLNEDMRLELNNMIKVIGAAVKSSSKEHPNHMRAKELIANIEEDLNKQNAAKPSNLTSLAEILKELLPKAVVYRSELLNLEKRILDLPKENSLKH